MSLEFLPYEKSNPRPRERDMEVLALDMSRTGTLSLWIALQKLGYTPYHMNEAARNSVNNSLVYWDEALRAKLYGQGKRYEGNDFEKMLWRYDAVSDIPCILFVDELLAAYPHAKVILTNRDVDSWLTSVERSFYELLESTRWLTLLILDTQFMAHHIPILYHALYAWTKGEWQNREKLRQGYLEHYQHVRDIVPKENLLEFTSKDGWEPLCRFLGKPVPEGEPYPHVNEGSFTADVHNRMLRRRMKVVTETTAKI